MTYDNLISLESSGVTKMTVTRSLFLALDRLLSPKHIFAQPPVDRATDPVYTIGKLRIYLEPK